MHLGRVLKLARLLRHAGNGILRVEHADAGAQSKGAVARIVIETCADIHRSMQHVAPVAHDKQIVTAGIDDLKLVIPRFQNLVNPELKEVAQRAA